MTRLFTYSPALVPAPRLVRQLVRRPGAAPAASVYVRAAPAKLPQLLPKSRGQACLADFCTALDACDWLLSFSLEELAMRLL